MNVASSKIWGEKRTKDAHKSYYITDLCRMCKKQTGWGSDKRQMSETLAKGQETKK